MAAKVAQVWQTAVLQQLERDFKRSMLYANPIVYSAVEWANTLAAADVIESRDDAEDFVNQLLDAVVLMAGPITGPEVTAAREDIVFTSLPFTVN